MKEMPYRPCVSATTKVVLAVLAAAAVLLLTLVVIAAPASPDFSTSYKTAPYYTKHGDVITYTIVAVNTGGPVENVVLSDTLPSSGVTFVPGSCTYIYLGEIWDCESLDQMWDGGVHFPTGYRITTTLAVTVTEVATGSAYLPLQNYAYLSWDGAQQAISATTNVVGVVPDFDSSYKTGPRFADAGDVITYTIVAVNAGEAVEGVILSDTLPSWVSFVPGSCTYTSGGGSSICGSLSQMWQEDLGADGRITTTFAVTVNAGTLWLPLTNTAYLSWGGVQHPLSVVMTVNARLYLPIVMLNS